MPLPMARRDLLSIGAHQALLAPDPTLVEWHASLWVDIRGKLVLVCRWHVALPRLVKLAMAVATLSVLKGDVAF